MSEITSATANAFESPRFGEMLKAELGSEEQQQFVMNFQLYLMYGEDNTKFPIDMDKILTWLGFLRRTNAKRLVMNNFVKDTDYIVTNLLASKSQQVHGGHTVDVILKWDTTMLSQHASYFFVIIVTGCIHQIQNTKQLFIIITFGRAYGA